MALRTICNCDTCGAEIDVTNGDHPARINAYAPTPASVGPQQEESHLCAACWEALCALFPRFRAAERFTVPSPSPAHAPVLPAIMDTWAAEQKEQFLAELGQAMGLRIVRTPEQATKAEQDDKG